MQDPFNLSRFLQAQQPVMNRVMDELKAGHKTSHWMWFVFPQLKGLGRSDMAQRFGLSGAAEARAYLAHQVLGARLQACVVEVLEHRHMSAAQIFGSPDDLKFRSCLTLFASVQTQSPVYRQALEQFYAGIADSKTVQLLGDEC
jgi:uncharacterized protein (DUF1810 family)